MRVLLTGSTGSVGRYVVEELLTTPALEVVLVVRDLAKLPEEVRTNPRVTTVHGDMHTVSSWLAAVGEVDRAVLLATSWGPYADAVNVNGTLELADALAVAGTVQLIHFGTASILDASGAGLEAARTDGTPYITSKATCRDALLERWPRALTIVHPTLVVAGGPGRLPSHFTRIVREVDHRAWLARWVTGDGSFHIVHAADLARVVGSLLQRPPDECPRELVAGAPSVSLAEALDLLLERSGRRRLASIDLTSRRIERLIRVFGVTLSPWDRRCLDQRHFTYRNARLALDGDPPPLYPTAREILAAIPR